MTSKVAPTDYDYSALFGPTERIQDVAMLRAALDLVSARSGEPIEQLLGRRRTPRLVYARYCVFKLLADSSCPVTVAARLTGRHHTLVCYGLERLRDWADSDPRVKADLEHLAIEFREMLAGMKGK